MGGSRSRMMVVFTWIACLGASSLGFVGIPHASPGAAVPLVADPTLSWVTALDPFNPAEGDLFGSSVAVSGDFAVVGATDDDDAGSNSGSAYVFDRDHGGANEWGQVAKLSASDAAAGDRFGRSVAISGNTAVVGSGGVGSAYVFERDQFDQWTEIKKLTGSGTPGGSFGGSVAISGDYVVVGAAPGS